MKKFGVLALSLSIFSLVAFTQHSSANDRLITLEPVTLAELAGSWKTVCTLVGGASEVSQLTFTAGGEVTDQANVYLGPDCKSGYYTSASKLDFSLNSDHLSATATPFDAMLQFESAAAVTAANTAPGVCGLTNWRLGVAQTIIGRDCSPRDTVKLKIGKVNATTIRIEVCAVDGTACRSADYIRQ